MVIGLVGLWPRSQCSRGQGIQFNGSWSKIVGCKGHCVNFCQNLAPFYYSWEYGGEVQCSVLTRGMEQ